jgi:hypothetical protein
MARSKSRRPPPPPQRAADDDQGAGAGGLNIPPEMLQAMLARSPGAVPSMKGGGTVPKTGIYKLHKGERVMAARPSKAAPRKK